MPSSIAAIVDWLSLPISGAAVHTIDPRVVWHARAMVLGWGVLLPLGALAARYLKILPGQGWPARLDHPLWWHAHRGCQYAGVVLTAVGLWLAWHPGRSPIGSLHAALGWVVAVGALLQVLGGWLRGSKGGPEMPHGDHYAMTPRRIVFERIHKALGWILLLAAMVTIGLGLRLADAPRWMPVTLGLWWATLGVIAIVLQRRGWCADTYQAIWGPSLDHPGNRIPPIGWGIRRGDRIRKSGSDSTFGGGWK